MVGDPSITVVSSLALKGVLEEFRPAFERRLASRLDLRFDATQAILAQIKDLRADLLVLTAEALEELRNSGTVAQVRALGSSGVGIAVRAGAPKPDIGSVDALKRALAAASSVAHSKVGASGIYFSELLQRLDIPLKNASWSRKGRSAWWSRRARRSSACSSFASSRRFRASTSSARSLDPLQKLTHFAAGIPLNASNPNGALALMQLLRSDEARAGMVRAVCNF